MNEQNEKIYLTSAPIKKLLLKFSIPCVLAMLVSALYNIVDQIFIGNSVAGTAGIMATTLVFPFTVVALAISLLIGDGCATLFSISLGAKDEKTSNKSVGNAIIAILLLSVLLVLFGFVFRDAIFNLLGVSGYNEMCQEYTKQYFTIILCGTPFYMFASSMASIIRASGAPGYSMVSTIVGAVLNLILDPVFIFGFDMGVQGAAIATIIGQIVSAILCVFYFRKPKLMNLNASSFKFDFDVLKRMFKLGISSFITQISIAIITIVANNIVGIIGGVNATDAGGALGIVFKIFAIVLAFSIGVSVGAQPIIGFNYGAKEYKRVLDTYKYVLVTNIIIGSIATIAFQFFPGAIVNLFGGHANDLEFYQQYAILSFRVYLGGIFLCCIQKASCIFLQSIDKPYKSMFLSLMRDVILLAPGVCILGLKGNLYSMLWAGPIADIGAFILTILFVRTECKKIAVLEHEKPFEAVLDSSPKGRFVISIGREYGSGGKFIGEELARRLDIKCYDNELLEKTAKTYHINLAMLEKIDEKQKSSFWYSFATNYVAGDESVNPIGADDSLFLKQSKVIEDLYNTENCIIIGRCSDYILKEKNGAISIFIYSSNEDFKIRRKMDLDKISYNEAKKRIRKIDKERANYYNRFTNQVWGDKKNYDLVIDSGKLGIEKTVDLLEKYIQKRIK